MLSAIFFYNYYIINQVLFETIKSNQENGIIRVYLLDTNYIAIVEFLFFKVYYNKASSSSIYKVICISNMCSRLNLWEIPYTEKTNFWILLSEQLRKQKVFVNCEHTIDEQTSNSMVLVVLSETGFVNQWTQVISTKFNRTSEYTPTFHEVASHRTLSSLIPKFPLCISVHCQHRAHAFFSSCEL